MQRAELVAEDIAEGRLQAVAIGLQNPVPSAAHRLAGEPKNDAKTSRLHRFVAEVYGQDFLPSLETRLATLQERGHALFVILA